MKISIISQPILLGFSSHTSMIVELLREAGFRGEVTIVKNIPVDESDYPYLVDGIWAESMMMDAFEPDVNNTYFLSVVRPPIKELLFDLACHQLKVTEEDFPMLIHSSCQVASTVKIGAATHIEQSSTIAPYAEIGMGVNIGHHTRVDDYVTVNPGVVIAGKCHIEKGVMIGVGATVFDNIHIGAGSIIGGGSLVTKSIPAGVVAFGNPCKVIREVS